MTKHPSFNAFRQIAEVSTIVCLLIASISTTQAAEKTVSGRVSDVDTTHKTITVDRLTLDLTRKTKVAVEGKTATLLDLKTGQQVTVTYDDKLDVAISVTAGKEIRIHDEATSKVLKSLDGEWVCIAAEEEGKAIDPKVVQSQNRHLTIKGGTLTMKRKIGNKHGGATGKIDLNPSSGQIDFRGDGPDGKPNEWVGIYHLEGDTLKLCYRFKTQTDAVRPKKFQSDEDHRHMAMFYTFERVKQ